MERNRRKRCFERIQFWYFPNFTCDFWWLLLSMGNSVTQGRLTFVSIPTFHLQDSLHLTELKLYVPSKQGIPFSFPSPSLSRSSYLLVCNLDYSACVSWNICKYLWLVYFVQVYLCTSVGQDFCFSQGRKMLALSHWMCRTHCCYLWVDLRVAPTFWWFDWRFCNIQICPWEHFSSCPVVSTPQNGPLNHTLIFLIFWGTTMLVPSARSP